MDKAKEKSLTICQFVKYFLFSALAVGRSNLEEFARHQTLTESSRKMNENE